MENLFSSFRLGSLDLINRIVFPPIKTALGNPSGEVTDKHLRFYSSISKNGPGIIILEPVSVSPEGREHPKQLQITQDNSVTELSKIVDVIQENGRKACLHLNHAGGAANPKVIGAAPLSASVFSCPSTGAETRPLSGEEIRQIVSAFGVAAGKAKEAGFDALEIQAGHGYLLAQFLNSEINNRDDDYGSDRTLLLRQVIQEVADIASGLTLILRVSGEEMAPGKSTNVEDIDKAIKLAHKAGFSAVHVGMGSSCFTPPWYFHHMSLPEQPQEKALARIKNSAEMPVIAAGRMGSLDRSKRILARNLADMIALGRPLIADPDLVAKWEGKDKEQIQHCGYCLQGCLVHVKDGSGIGCNFNPEITNPEIGKSEKPLSVLVAGGGPAGFSAAKYLTKRGHYVTLAEESDESGGLARLAPLAPGKKAMSDPINDLLSQNNFKDLRVMLSQKVDINLIRELKPDLLVWATGSRPRIPPFQGMNKDNLISCTQIFSGEKEVKGKRVLIIGAGRNGLELAEKLGKQGYQVVATKRTDAIGNFMEPISKKLCLARISKMPNVSVFPLTTVLEFTDKGVRIIREDQEQMLEKFDTVILCAGMIPAEGPSDDVAAEAPKIEIIGDANEPGDIYSAVKAGYELALKY
jgi:2,4-dienoyl-CoA reductase-like NADH-dependent reductase (Old Yellow Enzyme family)/thioredoxin reductase